MNAHRVALLLLSISAAGLLPSTVLPETHPGAPRSMSVRAMELRRLPLPLTPTGCLSFQTGETDAQMDIHGPFYAQFPCYPNNPAGDLAGFAFVLNGCMNGGIKEIAIDFPVFETGDLFYLFVWRSFNGLPLDACGLAPYAGIHLVENGPAFNICNQRVPVDDGERIFIGVVYRYILDVNGGDWFVGFNSASGFRDRGYINITGAHGAWVDLWSANRGYLWGIAMQMDSDCYSAPVVPTTWGTIKVLYW